MKNTQSDSSSLLILQGPCNAIKCKYIPPSGSALLHYGWVFLLSSWACLARFGVFTLHECGLPPGGVKLKLKLCLFRALPFLNFFASFFF